jgi:esterase/lipase
MEMQEMMDIIAEKDWPKMQLPPLVIIQGELDRASDAVNSLKFFTALATKEKELWYYRKMWHMFLYEEEYPEIENRIVDWLNYHLQ